MPHPPWLRPGSRSRSARRLAAVLALGAACSSGASAQGFGPPEAPPFPNGEQPLVSTAADTRPRLPARGVWMNTPAAPVEADVAGRPVVLLVWNARAVPALNTLPWFARLRRHFTRPGQGDAVFLLVHAPESADPAETGPPAIAAALNGVTRPGLGGVPVLLDNEGRFYAALGSPAIPTLFVYGRDGRLVDATVGRVGRYETRARAVGASIRAALVAHR